MADYPILSDVSTSLLKTLREHLCPEPLPSPESVQLASPADKKADFTLGVYLYDINGLDYRSSAQIRDSNNRRSFPPRPLVLSYLLYLNSKAQIALGAEAEQRVLGRCIQVLTDHPIVDIGAAHLFEGEADDDASITFLHMSFEEKSKIWQALSLPFQVGVHFTISPVMLSSRRSEPFVRVKRAEITLEQTKR